MNKAEIDLNYYKSYFHGVQDIVENKTKKQVALGFVKVASYVTLLVPIIFGVGYLIAERNWSQLSKLNSRISQSFHPNFNGPQPTQEDLIRFLIMRVQDVRHDLFETAFEKLQAQSQEAFFAQVAIKGKIAEAMDLVPKNARELSVNLGGDFLRPLLFQRAQKIVGKFLNHLHFPRLEKLTVDMKEIAYLTPLVQSHLEVLENGYKHFEHAGFRAQGVLDYFQISNTYAILNNYDAANTALDGLFQYFKQSDSLKQIQLRFQNVTLTLKKHENRPVLMHMTGKNIHFCRQGHIV